MWLIHRGGFSEAHLQTKGDAPGGPPEGRVRVRLESGDVIEVDEDDIEKVGLDNIDYSSLVGFKFCKWGAASNFTLLLMMMLLLLLLMMSLLIIVFTYEKYRGGEQKGNLSVVKNFIVNT